MGDVVKLDGPRPPSMGLRTNPAKINGDPSLSRIVGRIRAIEDKMARHPDNDAVQSACLKDRRMYVEKLQEMAPDIEAAAKMLAPLEEA